MLYDFELEGTSDPNRAEVEDEIGYGGGDVVLRFCSHLPQLKNHKLYFDNYFTYLELLLKLKEQGFWAVGTPRLDRMRGYRFSSEKELRKAGRGSCDAAVNFNCGLSLNRLYDNKAAQLASNYIGADPVDEVQRWSKSGRKMIAVIRPNIVKVYNSVMGGVDLFDMFQSLYRLGHKSRRWYVRIFYWMLASSIINAWLQYSRDFDDVQSA